jgi:organic hydroperoxide reductase OsmC/OhrA
MISRAHRYELTLEWTGNRGSGTSDYRAYGRDHVVRGERVPDIDGSSDRAFRGDPDRWNPEQLLLAAAAQCHLLSYLHVAVEHGVVVTAYSDRPTAVMTEDGQGGGRFTGITLHPVVTIADPAQLELAESLHGEANAKCFIAASLALPVGHEVTTCVAASAND